MPEKINISVFWHVYRMNVVENIIPIQKSFHLL